MKFKILLIFLSCNIFSQYYITSIDKGSNWGLVMSSGTGYSDQLWMTNEIFPESKIKEYGAKGFFITNVSYSGKVWIIVMSKGTGFTSQEYLTGSTFPKDFVSKVWDKGKKITEMIYANNIWVVVASDDKKLGTQMYYMSDTYPSEVIKEYWNDDYRISDLTYGEKQWCLIMHKENKSSQMHYESESYPENMIKEYWDKGYFITTLTFGQKKWAVVMTSKSIYTKQMWSTENNFPRETIELYWNKTYQPNTTIPTQDSPAGKTRVYVLCVGISDYSLDINSLGTDDLTYADSDARKVYEFFKSPRGGGLPDQQIYLMQNKNATRQNILDKCYEMFGKATDKDEVIFYFSGHGSPNSLLAYDKTIFHEDLKNIIYNTKARIKLCVADACHSGSWNKSKNYKIKGTTDDALLQSYYQTLDKAGNGIALFMASKEEEYSIEDGSIEQGVFTYFILKGLKGAADTEGNKNNIVTLNELYQYVYKNVSSYTEIRGDKQHPQLKGQYDENLPLSIIP